MGYRNDRYSDSYSYSDEYSRRSDDDLRRRRGDDRYRRYSDSRSDSDSYSSSGSSRGSSRSGGSRSGSESDGSRHSDGAWKEDDVPASGAYESPTSGGCKVPIDVTVQLMSMSGKLANTKKPLRLYWSDVLRTSEIKTLWEKEVSLRDTDDFSPFRLAELVWYRERELRFAKESWHAKHVWKELSRDTTPHLMRRYGAFMHSGDFQDDPDPKRGEMYDEWIERCPTLWNKKLIKEERMLGTVHDSADMTLGDYLREAVLTREKIETAEIRNIMFQITQGMHALQTRCHGRHLHLNLRSIFMTAPKASDDSSPPPCELHSYTYGVTGMSTVAKRHIAVCPEGAGGTAASLRDGVLTHTVSIDEYTRRGEFRVGDDDSIQEGTVFSLADAGVTGDIVDDNGNVNNVHNPIYEPHTAQSIYGPPSELFIVAKDSWFSFWRDWSDDMFSAGLIALELMVTGMKLTDSELAHFSGHHFGKSKRYAPGGRNDTVRSILEFKGSDENDAYTSLVNELDSDDRTARGTDKSYGTVLVNLCLLQAAMGNPLIPDAKDWPTVDGSSLKESENHASLADYIKKIPDMDIVRGTGRHFWAETVAYIRTTHGDTAIEFLRRMLHWNPATRDTSAVWGKGSIPGLDEEHEGKKFGFLYPMFHAFLAATDKEKEAYATPQKAADALLTPILAKRKNPTPVAIAAYGWTTASAELEPLPEFQGVRRADAEDNKYRNTFLKFSLKDEAVESYTLDYTTTVKSAEITTALVKMVMDQSDKLPKPRAIKSGGK